MTTNMENMAREQVREILPDAVRIALKSYRRFVREQLNGGEVPKATGTEHGTGKAALTHINMLLKLCKWADLQTKEIEKTLTDTSAARENYQKYLDEHEEDSAL